jgi:hypothetical protein
MSKNSQDKEPVADRVGTLPAAEAGGIGAREADARRPTHASEDLARRVQAMRDAILTQHELDECDPRYVREQPARIQRLSEALARIAWLDHMTLSEAQSIARAALTQPEDCRVAADLIAALPPASGEGEKIRGIVRVVRDYATNFDCGYLDDAADLIERYALARAPRSRTMVNAGLEECKQHIRAAARARRP